MKHPWSNEQITIINFSRDSGENFAVEAVAGSGKSSVGCEIVKVVPAKSITYVQHNKRNQLEMQSKITASNCQVVTSNALLNRFITARWGFCKAGTFWPEANRVNVFAPACKGIALNEIVKLVTACKNECITIPDENAVEKLACQYGIEDCTKQGYPLPKMIELAIQTLVLSLEKPKKGGYISWADQIWVPVVNNWVTPVSDFGLGDEFQDFNAVQHEAFMRLFPRKGILGDARQQIYSWRGAVDNGFSLMVERLNAKLLPMYTSFRCPKIIESKVQSNVPHFNVHPSAVNGEMNDITFDQMTKGCKYGDAILARKNSPLMPACLEFIRKGITARIEGKDIGKQLEQVVTNVGGKDICAFLDNLETWKQARISKAKGWNAQATIDFVSDQADTIKVLAESCNSVSDITRKIELLFEDSNGQNKPCIKLSTVHKAKGLEWDRVNILSDSFTVRQVASARATREEENIRYVADTRTKHTVNYVSGLASTPQP